MKQMSLGSGGFERYGKTTRRAAFLAEMDKVVPWAQLCALIEPHYPKAGRGRPPVPLQRMLRIHFLQHLCVTTMEAEICLRINGLRWNGTMRTD